MYIMKRYTVAALRSRLAEALDETERGVPVIIERRGVRYRLSMEPTKPRRKARTSTIEIVDPAVAEGRWNWQWTSAGLKFRGRRRS
jgi:antitoxin (DNA-binding transcriptional repressor) of toxin-antitoxin stability system